MQSLPMASMTRAAAAVQTPAAAASTSARRSAARFTGGYAGAQRHRHIRRSFVGGVAGARCQTCHVFGRSRGEPASLPLFLRRPSSPSANAASTGGGGGARQRRLTVTAAVVEPGSVVRGRSPAANVGEPVNVTEKVGILLLNLGGPEELDDVQPFLYNLFADPDIIRLPAAVRFLQSPLAALLSNSRAPKSRKAYESIGGGSPLRRITARGPHPSCPHYFPPIALKRMHASCEPRRLSPSPRLRLHVPVVTERTAVVHSCHEP